MIVTPSGSNSMEMTFMNITPIISIHKGLYFYLVLALGFHNLRSRDLY
jgi:hypothetical protein